MQESALAPEALPDSNSPPGPSLAGPRPKPPERKKSSTLWLLITVPILVGVGVVVLFILAGAASLIMLEARSRRTSHRTLEAVFQSTPEGAVLFDPVGRIVMWNTAFEALITDMGATIHAGDAKAVLFAAIDKAGWIGSEAFTRLRTPADDPLRTTEGPLPDGRILRIERRRLDDGWTCRGGHRRT